MPNPTTRQELLATMTEGYAQLNEQITKMSEAIPRTIFPTHTAKTITRWTR